MPQHAAKGPLFDNCLIVAPDGVALGRCALKKMNWYLDRKMAEHIGDDPPTIRLNFEPSGRKGVNDPFTIAGKPNHCCVCGTKQDLNRHHVIPHCFVRFLPEYAKKHNSHDIVPVCLRCHEKYELSTYSKRLEIAEAYNVPIHGLGQEEAAKWKRVRAISNSLIEHRDKMPAPRQLYLEQQLEEMLEYKPTFEQMRELAKIRPMLMTTTCKTMGQVVMEQVADFNAFAKLWRQHFLDTMKPQYMPGHWRVDRKFDEDYKP